MKLIKEIIRQHLTETGNRMLILTFNPPLIPGSAEYDVYIEALQKEFPTLVWASGTPVAGSTRFLPKNSVGNLIIRYHDGRHLLSWSDPGSYYLGIDAAEWLSSTQDFDTGDAFDSLYESDDSLEWAEDLFKSVPEFPKVDGQRRVVRTKGELTEDYVMIILQLLIDNGYYFGSGNGKSMAYRVTEILNDGGYLNLHPNGKLSYGDDEESLNQAYDVYYSELPNIFI